MTVTIRPVTKHDLGPLFDLKVLEEQRPFVAPNEVTLAEAAYEDGAYVFTIWAQDTPVGLLGLIDMTELEDAAPEDEPTAGFIWRLAVGAEHQGKGFGTAAIEWEFDWARARGCPRMSVEVEMTNKAALALYERLGFRRTGVMYGDVAQLARQLT